MATTAMSWFYRAPERRPYLIAERVNNTFWDMRITGLYLAVTRAEPPFEMHGTYNSAQVRLEWEPARWLRLGTNPGAPALTRGLANILRRKPDLSYDTAEGETVWEWWLEGADKRWQEVQGRPAFRNPAWLSSEA
jgi:hypothetical protein